MAKSQDAKKSVKKEPAKTPKEKNQEKELSYYKKELKDLVKLQD